MPLSADRRTPRLEGDEFEGRLAANQTVFAGALLMRDTDGNLRRGAAATGMTGAGRAEAGAVSGATAGVVPVRVRPGTFRFANSTGADALGKADIGKVCWIADDDRVARTSASSTRSRAGIVEFVDAEGVWVRFDEALARVGTVTAA